MESFGNFLNSLSEFLTSDQQVINADNEDRRNSNFSESGYGTDDSRRSSRDQLDVASNNTESSRFNAIRRQARENDDEDFEVRGIRAGRFEVPNNNNNNNNNVGPGIGAIVGIAALAIGGYAIGKAIFSKEKKLSETKDEIVEKLKEIEKDTKEFPVVGLDCQWSATFDGSRRNKIALLQIASHKGNVLLLQINKLYTFPEELKILLRNRNIIKSGLEVIKDARYLQEDYGLNVIGTFDLRFLAENTGHRPESLPKLANKILDMELNKDWELIASDWNKDQLDENQLAYAEKAVRASVDIFKKLVPFVVTKVNRAEILNYCAEYSDRAYVFYSQNYNW